MISCKNYLLLLLTILINVSLAEVDESNPSDMVSKQIHQLDDEDFINRDVATKALLKWAKQQPKMSSPILCDYYFKTESPETSARLRSIIKELFYNRSKPVLGLNFIERNIILANGRTVRAMLVTRVSNGKAAHKAGIQKGDYIIKIGGKLPEQKPTIFIAKADITSLVVGEKVPFHVKRDDDILILKLRVEGKPVIDKSSDQKVENEALFENWLEQQRQTSEK